MNVALTGRSTITPKRVPIPSAAPAPTPAPAPRSNAKLASALSGGPRELRREVPQATNDTAGWNDPLTNGGGFGPSARGIAEGINSSDPVIRDFSNQLGQGLLKNSSGGSPFGGDAFSGRDNDGAGNPPPLPVGSLPAGGPTVDPAVSFNDNGGVPLPIDPTRAGTAVDAYNTRGPGVAGAWFDWGQDRIDDAIRQGIIKVDPATGIASPGANPDEGIGRPLVESIYDQVENLGGNDWGYLGNTRNDPAKGYVTDLGIFNEETGAYTLLKELSSETLGPIAWADKDSFVYATQNAGSNLMNLYYYDNGTETLLSSSLPAIPGRGYGTDLVLRLIFSPAKDKVLFIYTDDLDQRRPLFVFDLQEMKQLIMLENIYTADWLDNSNIVYQDQEKEVLKFNLKTNTKTSVAKHSDYLVGMRALQNKVVFWKYQVEPVDSNLYSYDLNSGETRLLLESATAPVWLSDTKVVAVRLQDNSSEFILNPKTSSGLVVIDLKLSQVTLLEETLSDKSIYNLSTIYNPSANESFLGLD